MDGEIYPKIEFMWEYKFRITFMKHILRLN